MRILNYNSVKHNIYLFDEQTELVLVGSLPPSPNEFSSKIKRQHQQPVGYNSLGLWNSLSGYSGLYSPDWSGLHVRGRGSSRNTANPPHHTYYKGIALYQEPAPYADVLDINNWNNELPAFAIVSPKHFVACRHFIGFSNRAPQYIRLLGKDGQFINKLGRLVSNYEDTNLYELDEPLTSAEQTQVKIYDIVNPGTVPLEATFWHQGPNGSFNAYRLMQYNVVPPILQELNALYSEFPTASPLNGFPAEGAPNQIWSGDSGSPILVTYNNETYLYGFAYGWQIYGQSDIWNWLNSQLVAAGVTKSLVNLSDPSVLAISTESNSNLKYKAGFLEEAATSGISFINSPNTNQIAFIKLCGPAALIENAYVENIRINQEDMEPRKFQCTVRGANDQVIFAPNDFADTDENLLGSIMVHGFLAGSNECYLTYAVRVNDIYTDASSLPNYRYESPEDEKYYLSPFAIEPNVGDVFLSVRRNLDLVNSAFVETDLLPTNSSSLVAFKEGYNYQLSTSSDNQIPTFDLAATPGAGLGRLPCDADIPKVNSEEIRTINKQQPNEMGGFSLTSAAAECLTVDPILESNDIKLESHCAPCCRCSDYTDTGKYIRSYAEIYAALAKQYKELVERYNSINEQFSNQGGGNCCDTFNIVNPRFKLWPQQNFMLQVQALMENNTKQPLCLCGVRLMLEAEVLPDEGSNVLSEVETLVDDEGNSIQVTHSIPQGKFLIVTPLKEASYLYFKSVNPGNKELNISMEDSDESGADKKRMIVQVDLNNGSVPIPLPCNDAPASALPSNCMESCDGYLMMTAGLTISDPIFRKIVHLRKKRLNNEFEGLDVKVNIFFSYEGPTSGDVCSQCVKGNWITIPPAGASRIVRMSANRKSVDPCAPVRLKNLQAAPDNPGDLVASFTGNVNLEIGQTATLTVVRKAFNSSTNTWVAAGQATRTITAADADPNGDIVSVIIPNNISYNGGVGGDAVALSYTAVITGERLVSKCFPNPNDPNYSINVNVAPSTASYSRRL